MEQETLNLQDSKLQSSPQSLENSSRSSDKSSRESEQPAKPNPLKLSVLEQRLKDGWKIEKVQ